VGNSKILKISIAKRNDGGGEKALLKKYGRDWKGVRHTVRHGGLCLPDSVVNDGSYGKEVVLVVNSMLDCFLVSVCSLQFVGQVSTLRLFHAVIIEIWTMWWKHDAPSIVIV